MCFANDGALASCQSSVETGFWGFTRGKCGAGGSTECPSNIQGDGLCQTTDLEFDTEDGGAFPVTSGDGGAFHIALPPGNYQACCTAFHAQTPTCQSIALHDKQSRHIDEATYYTAGGSTCSFTLF